MVHVPWPLQSVVIDLMEGPKSRTSGLLISRSNAATDRRYLLYALVFTIGMAPFCLPQAVRALME